MTTATGKTRCVICGKEKATSRCGGCLEEFCSKHLADHQQELNKQLDEIEVNRDLFRQSLTEQIEKPNNYMLIEQIDEWKHHSIKKIEQTAKEVRQILLKNTKEFIHPLEIKFNELINQIRQCREEKDFNQINLRHFQEELKQLTKQLAKPSTISVREDSKPFISKISVDMSESTVQSNIHHDTRWIQNGFTVAGGNGQGNELNQLSYPYSVFVDDDQTIYVADSGNHRIVEWKCGATNGRVVVGENRKGNNSDQLCDPRDVLVDKQRDCLIICDYNNRRVVRWPRRNDTSGETIIDKIDCCRLTLDNNGYLYVSDYIKSEVRQWKMNDTCGTLIAGGNEQGNRLNQLHVPAYIFVDEDHSLYVSDYCNDRVIKWIEGGKEGIVVAGGQGKGNDLTQLSGPCGLIVDHSGTVYVADRDNHRIMRWSKGATQGNILIGGNRKGKQANQLTGPEGLSFDRHGNLYIVDRSNHRVQRFDIDRS